MKRRKTNREHVPFLTRKLLEAITKRKKLKRYYNKSKCRLDWDRYKGKAVSNYFRTTAANAKGNPNKFWQMVKHVHLRSNLYLRHLIKKSKIIIIISYWL